MTEPQLLIVALTTIPAIIGILINNAPLNDVKDTLVGDPEPASSASKRPRHEPRLAGCEP